MRPTRQSLVRLMFTATVLMSCSARQESRVFTAGPGTQAQLVTTIVSVQTVDWDNLPESTSASVSTSPQVTLLTQPAPAGFADNGPIDPERFQPIVLSDLNNITPGIPIDSIVMVEVHFHLGSVGEWTQQFTTKQTVGTPCKTSSDQVACQRQFATSISTLPKRFFPDPCGNCASYLARYLVITAGDEVLAGLSDLSYFGAVDTPTEVGWKFVSTLARLPSIRQSGSGFDVLDSFDLDECSPSITRMQVSKAHPDGTFSPVQFHDELPPDPGAGMACP
jgi:hypothetical protein